MTRDVAAGFAVDAVRPLGRRCPTTLGADVWVKDETGNVGGSHKGRHLVTILLHLRAAEALRLAERSRRPLAIASCGNAAIAAATLAARAEWPIEVFVPDWASAARARRCWRRWARRSRRCERRADDPPGDPAVLRFREAVDAGAVPFSVQGPENALCLDGGRTIGWELADAGVALDRVVVQVGGGAFAACTGWGLGPGVPARRRAGRGLRAAGAGVGAGGARLAPDDVAGALGRADDAVGRPALGGRRHPRRRDLRLARRVRRRCARSGGRPLVVARGGDRAGPRARPRPPASPSAPPAPPASPACSPPAGAPAPGERVAVIFSGVDR